MTSGERGTRPLPVSPPEKSADQWYPAEQPTIAIDRVSAEIAPTLSTPFRPGSERTMPSAGSTVRPGRPVRILEAVSGLLGGGLLLAGIVLLIAHFVAPHAVTGGRGPSTEAIVTHFGVGVVAEVLRAVRNRMSVPVRVAAAGAVILATIGVLILIWW